MRVLVTGGSGRVGRFVVPELETAGYEIAIFDLVEPQDRRPRYIKGDLRNLAEVMEATRNIEAIVHLAAIPTYTGEDQKIMETNVMGTFNLLEAAVKNGVKKVVCATSLCAVGFIFWKKPFTPDYFPIDEKHPCKPDDAYGLSKLIDEKLCYAYTQRHGISTVCLRMASVFFEEELKGFLPNIGTPDLFKDMIWNYVDPRDVAQAYRLALKKADIEHELYNIGAPDVFSELDSLELIRRYYPEVKLILNENDFLADKNKALFDISKARRELGYKPRFTWRKLSPKRK
jgi:nucleoside-diphosphate-sugar epimerase